MPTRRAAPLAIPRLETVVDLVPIAGLVAEGHGMMGQFTIA